MEIDIDKIRDIADEEIRSIAKSDDIDVDFLRSRDGMPMVALKKNDVEEIYCITITMYFPEQAIIKVRYAERHHIKSPTYYVLMEKIKDETDLRKKLRTKLRKCWEFIIDDFNKFYARTIKMRNLTKTLEETMKKLNRIITYPYRVRFRVPNSDTVFIYVLDNEEILTITLTKQKILMEGDIQKIVNLNMNEILRAVSEIEI